MQSPTPVQGPLAVGDINGAFPGVPPDEIVTGVGAADTLGLRFRTSAADVLLKQCAHGAGRRVGGRRRPQPRRSPGRARRPVREQRERRADSIHYFLMGASELEQVARTLPSTPGLDAVAIADVDADGCSDVVGAGGNGRGMIHLGDGAGGFDGGQDLPQLGYQNPATATRATMAVSDLTGDGRPELVIADQLGNAVMVYRNASTPAGGPCYVTPPPPTEEQVPVVTNPPAVVVPTPAPTPIPRRWLRAPVRNREARVTSSGRPVTMCSSAASAATC